MSGAADEPIADPRRREQARDYARIRRRLFLADLVSSAALLALLLASGASLWLRRTIEATVPAYLGHVAAYVVVLAAGYVIAALPLAYYGGFALPHRYELSVQTRRAWVADYLKGALLGLAEGLIVALVVYALLRAAPRWCWLWAALAITAFAVALTNLAPVLIVPLFYKLRPLADGDLRRRLLALAAAAGTRVRGVYVIDMSRRTRATNAALMGIGTTRRIVLGDTMWERFTPDEIAAVLAHELGHHVHHDLWRGIALEAALTFAALWVAGQLMPALAAPLGLAGVDDVAGLPLLLLVVGSLFTILLPVTNGFSRRWEAAADRFAVRVTGDRAAWRGALTKLADQNLAEVDPPPWVEWLLYSHPSIRRRLEAAGGVPPGAPHREPGSTVGPPIAHRADAENAEL